jgi:hypothetical protein
MVKAEFALLFGYRFDVYRQSTVSAHNIRDRL